MVILVALALLSGFAEAKSVVVTPTVPVVELDLSDIEKAMRTAGHAVIDTQCSGAKCVVSLPDASPATEATLATFFAPAKTVTQLRAELRAELEAIEDAIDAGTETAAQRRRFMRIILKLNGLSKRP